MNRLWIGLVAALCPLIAGCPPVESGPAWVFEPVEPVRSAAMDAPVADAVRPSGASALTPADFDAGGEPRPLSLHNAVALAMAGNREIRIARHGPGIAAAGVAEARSAYDPVAFAQSMWTRDRNAGQSFFGASGGTETHSLTEQAGMRQRLPTGADISAYREWHNGRESGGGYPATRESGQAMALEAVQPLLLNRGNREVRDTIRIARIRLGQSEEEFKAMVADILARVAEDYWRLAQACGELRIGRENLALAREVLMREESRAEKRVATSLDVERAREAAASRMIECGRAEEQCEILRERLALYLNAPGAKAPGAAGFAPADALAFGAEAFDEEAECRAALENRPELRVAGFETEAARVRYEYARHTRLPRLDLRGTLRDNRSGDSDGLWSGSSRNNAGTDFSVGMVLEVPVGGMRSKALRARGLAEWRQREEIGELTREEVLSGTRIALRSLAIASGEIPAAERAVEAARKVIEGEQAKFEMNPAGNQDLLRAHDLLAATERNHVAALLRRRLARLALERAKGTLPAYLGVHLDGSGRSP